MAWVCRSEKGKRERRKRWRRERVILKSVKRKMNTKRRNQPTKKQSATSARHSVVCYLLGTLLFIKAKAAFVTSALLQDNNNYVHILFL
jgi:hypothetical protein